MPTYDTTDRYALRALSPGSQPGSGIDDGFVALRDDVSAKLTPYDAGALASRPVSTPGTPGKAGRRYYASDLSIEFVDLGTAWAPTGLPIGGGFDWFGTGDPCAELMICDGRALSRSTYAALFARLGTAFGAGNGATTFNLPSMADNVLVGVSGTVARGATGGAKTHTLATTELPAHAHGVADPGHTHVPANAQGGFVTSSAGATQLDNGAGTLVNPQGLAVTDNKATGISIQNAGGGVSHNNMQPYLGAYKVIRVL